MKTSKPMNRKTSSNHKENTNCGNKDQFCDICAQNVPGPERENIFAFGKCDHFVCYVCSARLRVICDQSECPICRNKLDTVVFSSNKKISYEKYNLKNCLYNEKYKIYFENKAIRDAFDKLLRYECQECLKTERITNIKSSKRSASQKLTKSCSNQEQGGSDNWLNKPNSSTTSTPTTATATSGANVQESTRDNSTGPSRQTSPRDDKRAIRGDTSPVERIEEDAQGLLSTSDVVSNVFPDAFGLKNHLNYVHRLKLCDLCLTHNKLFPFEFSYYDSAGLDKHMKEGAPKTSHRGHPNCTLCHNTFFNNDELIQHMSREHYYCHLCGRHDSTMRIYFLDYSNLREHFKNKHFLCERDNCRYEQFISAFDNRIDFQLHLVETHGNQSSNLSRGEARQQRTITLDSAPHRARNISPTRSMRQSLPPNAALVSTGTMATANSARQQRPSESTQLRQQRLPTRAEFPALGNAPSGSSNINNNNNSSGSSSSSSFPAQVVPSVNANNFPRLVTTMYRVQVPASTSRLSDRLAAGPSSSGVNSFVRTLGGGNRAPNQLNEMDFPPLPEQPKPKGVKKPKAQSNLQLRNDNTSGLTLDQLISSSLTLSHKNNKYNGKKAGSKGGNSKPGKQKAIKIQL